MIQTSWELGDLQQPHGLAALTLWCTEPLAVPGASPSPAGAGEELGRTSTAPQALQMLSQGAGGSSPPRPCRKPPAGCVLPCFNKKGQKMPPVTP